MQSLLYQRDEITLRYLRHLLLTDEVAEKIIHHLPTKNQEEFLDLLTILLGRLLQIQEANEITEAVEREIQQIAKIAYDGLSSVHNKEVRHAMLEILSYLPARSSTEIKFVLKLAEGTSDENIQSACAVALRRAQPETSQAKDVLQIAARSSVEIVRIAADLRGKKQEAR